MRGVRGAKRDHYVAQRHPTNSSIVHAVAAEYAYTTIPTYPSGQIGFIVATKNRGSCKKPAKVDSEMEKGLRYYNSELHEASFVLPNFARRAIFGDAEK